MSFSHAPPTPGHIDFSSVIMHYRDGRGWIGEDGDAESTPAQARFDLPAGLTIGQIADAARIAAAKFLARELKGCEVRFADDCVLQFTGETVGEMCCSLRVKFRCGRPNFGDVIDLTTLRESIESGGREDHPQYDTMMRVHRFCEALGEVGEEGRIDRLWVRHVRTPGADGHARAKETISYGVTNPYTRQVERAGGLVVHIDRITGERVEDAE